MAEGRKDKEWVRRGEQVEEARREGCAGGERRGWLGDGVGGAWSRERMSGRVDTGKNGRCLGGG